MRIMIASDCFLNQEFLEGINKMSSRMKDFSGNKGVIVHHNDADGICSAAILTKLCEHLGIDADRVCLEKVHPILVDRIHSKYEGGVVIYTDLAGLAANMISRVNAGRCTVWIIDHHPASFIDENDSFFMLDSEVLGVSGDIFISASTLNYLLAVSVSEELKQYAYLAVVGSVGDYHDRSGGILGFDRFALEEALSLGQVKVKIEGARERYYIKFFNEFASDVARRLTNLGTVGYERKGYVKGIRACLEGFDEGTVREAEELERVKKEKFESAIRYLRNGGLHIDGYVQWFHLEDMFSPMGVKAVGEFCQLIKDMSFIKEDRYLIGFQNCSRYIPDLGDVEWNAVKVSGRIPTLLERKVLSGEVPGYEIIFPKASEAVGGIADATHKIAAATLIEKGREKDFIKAFNQVIEERIGVSVQPA